MIRRWDSAHKGSMLHVLKRFAWRLDAFHLVLVLYSHILQQLPLGEMRDINDGSFSKFNGNI